MKVIHAISIQIKMLLMLLILSSVFQQCFSKNENAKPLIEFESSPNLTQLQNHFAQVWILQPNVMQYAFCRINTDVLINDQLTLSLLNGKEISIIKRNEVEREAKM